MFGVIGSLDSEGVHPGGMAAISQELVSTQFRENDNNTAFIFLSPIFLSAFYPLRLTKRWGTKRLRTKQGSSDHVNLAFNQRSTDARSVGTGCNPDR